MGEIYFPSLNENNPWVLDVELFLGREQKYKFLFDEKSKGNLTIPEHLHQLEGKEKNNF